MQDLDIYFKVTFPENAVIEGLIFIGVSSLDHYKAKNGATAPDTQCPLPNGVNSHLFSGNFKC